MFDHDHSAHHGHAHHLAAGTEKNRVAFVSVLAALVLTGTKVGVGLWTGSLGVLAEALHSGLDLMAAVVTLWAVHASSRPADKEHAYGHGKIENLSALFETVLLLATSAWIIKEAVARLFFRADAHVDANVWSFLVVILSIAVDFSRSRALQKVARKYDSQALEADALHFATDIWSSLVVLVGLAGVLASQLLGIPWLAMADAVAALGVAVVVVLVSLRMGKKSIADLLDAVPSDLAGRISGLAVVDGVREVRQVRVRRSGPEIFVDLVLVVDRSESLQRSHEIACGAEAAIKRELPRADVVVHVEPAEGAGDDLLATARRIAASHDASAHNLLFYEEEAGLVLELHLEMDGALRLAQAHQRAAEIEQELRRMTPRLDRVVTHIEPSGGIRVSASASEQERSEIREALFRVPEFASRGIVPRNVEIKRCGCELSLSFQCVLPSSTSIKEAHDFTERIERALRSQIPHLGRVMARTEPSD
jgi:cation diffusion facilitator family transporter